MNAFPVYKIGIDLGGTKTEAVLLDPDDHELYRHRIRTPREDGYDAILETVLAMIFETTEKIPGKAEYSIGVGIPGMIDRETQLVNNANTTCMIGKPFQKDLERRLNRKIMVENDANCFTLAESLKGAAKGYNLVFGVIMGTGCGGGICINGNIHRGIHGIAGEWGHFMVDPQGAPCYCGKRGCVETKISGGGVESAFSEKYGMHRSMIEILEGYRNDKPECREAFVRFLEDFGQCLGGVISVLDPDAVVIGGGLSQIDELYTLGVERVRHYTFHRNIRTPILKNQLGDSAGVFGSAWGGICEKFD